MQHAITTEAIIASTNGNSNTRNQNVKQNEAILHVSITIKSILITCNVVFLDVFIFVKKHQMIQMRSVNQTSFISFLSLI